MPHCFAKIILKHTMYSAAVRHVMTTRKSPSSGIDPSQAPPWQAFMSLRAVRTEPTMATTNQKIWHASVLSMDGFSTSEKIHGLVSMMVYPVYHIGKWKKRNFSEMLGDLYAPIHKISRWLGTPRKLRLYCMIGWFIEIGTWKMMEIPKIETTIWTCLKPPTIMISSFPLVGSSLYQFSFIRESKSKAWYLMKHPWNPNPRYPRSPAAMRYQWFLCIPSGKLT